MNISILYKDSSLIVCEKPVGISSESPGLPDLLTAQTGLKVWPVHRLDQGTGGAVVFALSSAAAASMQGLFLSSEVHKEYMSVISGMADESSGTFRDFLWHDRKKNKSYVVNRIRGGVRDAVCDWKVVETAVYGNQFLSLVRVRLHTGRTHQIRVQFGNRGYPLVGDRKYGSRIPSGSPALWSASLSFPHPVQKNSEVSVTSEPPPVFPWNLFSFRENDQ